ncbi:MAG TPA: PAS domain S-box protein [Rubrivivax sp.]|nr:PAS domain S-box protein [Rubrivivax sp.]
MNRTGAATRQPASVSIDSVHRGAVNAAHEGIVTIDDEQRIVMINPAALRMFGCSAAEALGAPLSRFIPLAQRSAHARHVREFDASGATEKAMGQRGIVTGLRANGELFPAAASISRVDVRGEAGTSRYFTALLCDLSQEQVLRDQLDALNQHMRAVFELAPVAIWITDGDRIVFANRASAALFGAATREVLIGRSIYALLAPDSHEPVRRTVAQALADDSPAPALSERIARLDGTVREVVIAVAALPDHGHTAVQMVITDITERAQERRELERSRRELRMLSANMVDAREDERRRIARELHDELGQRLTALKMELASLGAQVRAEVRASRVAAMLEMVDETVASVRRISTDLRPLMLDDLGLNAAIEWLAHSWGARMGIKVDLRLGRSDPDVGDAAAIALYRMVQEALTNIARHAHASQVRIQTRSRGGELLLTVQDNGVGFAEASMYREGSHGLMGMRERAYMLGGELEIGNARGGGGRIAVRLPLRQAVATTSDANPPR